MEIQLWRSILCPYELAVRELIVKFEHIISEHRENDLYSPIEQVSGRVKSVSSILEKMQRKHIPMERMEEEVEDIAGIRIICSFTSDIYRIAEMLRNQSDIKVISIKDYIKSPKESGYKSYHMLVSVPIYLSDSVVDTKVEIQIRTVAMDFWASLEHKMNYKFERNAPEHIVTELYECAMMVSELDAKMLSLNEEIQQTVATDRENG